jgi:stage II sporulation protein D
MTRRRSRRLIGALVIAAAIGACAPRRTVSVPSEAVPAIGDTLRVRVNGRIERVPLDLYSAAVALTEIAPGAVPQATAEALYEAQILVARTYAASRRGRHGAEGFDLCDSTHCQRYEPARLQSARWAQLARTLAARTSRDVLVHGGRLIEAVFHADCGGHTANARDVWGSAREYLVAKKDNVKQAHREWTSTLERDAVFAALRADRRTRIEGPLRDIAIARRDSSGRAARVRIKGRTTVDVDGDVFRAVVTAALGAKALPSTRFAMRRDGGTWKLTGTGFGHGVGLCQVGALARARAGQKAAEILRFYYPGAIIRRAAAG